MKRLLFFLACFSSLFASGVSTTFQPYRLETFYDVFVCEQKDDLSAANLTTPCRAVNPDVPPDPPPAPPPIAGYLPIVIVNNSGLPDSEVFVVVTGADPVVTTTQVFLSINTSTGIGTRVTAATGQNATMFTVALSQLPPVSHNGHVIYFPEISGGEVWFSMLSKLNMPVNGNAIVQPAFNNPGDPNYTTNFDIFEVAYVTATTPNIVADATAVSFFSLPLYGYMSTPSSPNNTTGLYHRRSTIEAHAASYFSAAPEASQWNKLILMSGGTFLRILSPGKSMAIPAFDANYLDDMASYGYSYISDIWSGGSSFYRTHSPIVMTIPNGSLQTYHGVIQANNSIIFTSQGSPTYTVVFAPPTMATPSTTFDVFSGTLLVSSDNSPGAADGVQLSKLFEEAIIAGLIPTTNNVSNPYLLANQSNYYNVNPNLTGAGPSTGPWYDLYSKALHSLGSIYTFAYDEPLWPDVQITSNSLETSTYVGITIGNVVD